MQDDKPHGTSSDLRKQAELRIQERFPNSEAVSNLTREEVEKLVHELQVHQIELEVQAEELRRAQTEVESLKDKYLDLYDFAPTGYVTVGANGLLIEANLTACRLLGRDRRSLINQPLSRFICRDDQDIYYLFREKSSQTQERQTCDVRLLNSDGEVFHSQLTALVMQDGEGASDGCRIAIADITERKRVEEALIGSEARLTEAERIAKSGNWEWDALKSKVHWSLGTYRIFDVKHDEFTPDYESHLKFVLPEEREEYEKRIRHCFDTKEPFEYEMGIVTPVGQIKNLSVRGYVKLDDQGNPIGMLGTCQDISDRKEMEVDLKNALQDMRASHVETNGYLEASRSLLEGRDFESAARTIFDACKRLIGATAGYVALLSDDGDENEILFLDAGGRECNVDPHLPMPIRGLREVAYTTGKAVYDNSFSESTWMEYMPEGHVALDNAMFAPMIMHGKAVGLLGLANKPEGFDDRDLKVSTAFAEYAAIGLKNALAEEALRASEEKYRTLFEESFDGLFITSAGGRILDMNKKGVEMFGYDTKEEVLRLDLERDVYAYPPDRERILSMVNAQGSAEYEVVVKKKGGEEIIAYCSLTAVRDETGNITSYRGIIRDITDRKRAEEALRESENKFRSLVEQASEMLFLHDESGRIVDVNQAAVSQTGYTRKELLSMQVFDIDPDATDRDDKASFWSALKPGDKPVTLEVSHRRKDGSIYAGEMTISKISLKGAEYIMAMGRDITERKRAEEALRTSEEKYRTVVEESFDGIFIRKGMVITFANARLHEMLGYDQGELRGLDHWLIYHPDYQELSRSRSQARLRGESAIPRYEVELLRKDGTSFPGEVNAKVIFFENEPGVQVWVRDLTQQKLLEKRLIEAQKMEAVGTLAGGIAHDFNNILQVVSGHAELLEMELAQKGMRFSEMDAIRHASHRGADLVKQILTFSRRVESKLEVINLNEDVKNVERLLYRTIPKMIHIEMKLEDELKHIQADSNQVEQVLLNLAVNAKDAMPRGGNLTITTQNVNVEGQHCEVCGEHFSGQYVLLTVSDTGHGISEEVSSHIFEPFFTTKGPGEGTGLGLSTVLGIVKLHGGHISCQSEVGKGTAFLIYFPVAETAVPDRESKRDDTEALGGSEKILVVDDEELISDLAKRILEKAGYSVITASSGKEALKVYSQNKADIDLVLLDLIMPEMGGEDCLRGLLKINPQVKALIASGFAVKGDTKVFLNEEAKGRVTKPFNMRELLRSVRHVLDGV